MIPRSSGARWLRAACAVALVFGASSAPFGCTDRRLVPIENENLRNYDDRLEIEASFCTRPVDEVVFPVKVLLVIDGSGSMQVTDRPNARRAAVRDLKSSLERQDNVQLATLVFGSNIYSYPLVAPGSPLFVAARDWVEPAFLGVADVTTNYQGALSAIRSHLLLDMLASDPAELARTKYVVIFFSDGAPLPVCCIAAEETIGQLGQLPFNCQPEPWEVADPNLAYCEGAPELQLCNSDVWLDNFRNRNTTADAPNYGDGTLQAFDQLDPGGNYNRTYQILDLMHEIMQLGETFGVGELRFHTALLYDDTLPPDVKREFLLNRCTSSRLLQTMAEIGNGVFRDFENSEEIDFLSFNFTALKQRYALIGTHAYNANALPTPDGFLVDSDGDGLPDEEELELGTDPIVRDSDKLLQPPIAGQTPDVLPEAQWGDGYSDLVEARRLAVGYDPRYRSLPVTPCPAFSPFRVDRQDLDGDGLNGCEEALYGTDPERADTDGDGLSDWLEVRLGLDPLRNEAGRDDDFDGVPNMEEVRRGTHPRMPDPRRSGDVVRYELIHEGETADGRTCYRARVKNLQLVTTEPRFAGGRSGYNDIYFWIVEAPADNPKGRTELRYACVRAQYIAPRYKDPPQGSVTLDESAFVDLSSPDDIARIRAGEDLCVGRRVQ